MAGVHLPAMGDSKKTIRIAAVEAPKVEGAGEWGSAVRLADKALTDS
jgi:hypothetical protein